jgi:2-keto-3-deoxy-L-rhamnonate aldolase RhmA
MENANKFGDKIRRGEASLGTVITFVDSTVTEALRSLLDFVWIDMEHNVLSLEAVQAHSMSTKSSDTTSLDRMPLTGCHARAR